MALVRLIAAVDVAVPSIFKSELATAEAAEVQTLPTVAAVCPRCGWSNTRLSFTKGPLDTILEDYVEDSKTAEQIAAERKFDFDLVKRVINMVERSEYKRQQAAPGLKISEKAFGVGRRFPIAAKSEV